MNAASHFISVLLGIGSFLGLPYSPLSTHLPPPPPVTLPDLERPASPNIFSTLGGPASTTFSSFAPLLPPAYTTSTPENLLKKPTPTKKEKLPTLAIQVPSFTPIPVSNPVTTTPTLPSVPQVSVPSTVPALPTVPVSPSTESGQATSTGSGQASSTNPTPSTPPSNTTLKAKATAAVVNIYCTTQVGSTITIVTGSGVVIDSRGVILTNAHVADHILLADYLNDPNKNCAIRKGSPAVSFYKATMLYISPAWLRAHGDEINQSSQSQETGEGDYALILINGAVNGNSLPASFSSLPADITEGSLEDNTPVLAVGYPAGNLGSDEVIRNLKIETDELSIDTNYTFANGGAAPDLIRTTGTAIAERGASGGGIANTDGKLIGLIATTIPDEHSHLKDLQALTLSYINRDLQRNAGLSLSAFLNRNLAAVAANFKAHDEQELISFLPH